MDNCLLFEKEEGIIILGSIIMYFTIHNDSPIWQFIIISC